MSNDVRDMLEHIVTLHELQAPLDDIDVSIAEARELLDKTEEVPMKDNFIWWVLLCAVAAGLMTAADRFFGWGLYAF